MFRRSEKKIKAVFKMQFRATQVPQLKAKRLMISLVPVDVGKPTVRLPKVPILQGTCTWENAVYETVKLVMETKTGHIREKFYYVIVSTGSSKSGFLGEVSIDFGDLADATKPLNLTLPLQTSKSGAVLHITVQKMQEEGSDSRHDDDSEATGDETHNQHLDTEKESHTIKKKIAEYPESNESSEVTSLHDVQNVSLEDGESDNNTSATINGAKEIPNEMIESFTAQIKMLERKVEVSELEVQSLRKQIIKEIRRGEQLAQQILCREEEREAFKTECEQLKSSATCTNQETLSSQKQQEMENLRTALEKFKNEVQHHKHSHEKLRRKLQQAEDSNSEYVIAMRDLTQKLDQKNIDISRLSDKIKALDGGSEKLAAPTGRRMDGYEESKADADEKEILKQKIGKLENEIEFLKIEKEKAHMEVQRLTQDYESLETENEEIYSKLEQGEKEKMGIQSCYAELLSEVKRFELRVADLEAENRRQALQYTESLNMIDKLDYQVEGLQKELEKQRQVFQEDVKALTDARIDQEQRAMRAEEDLSKARQRHADALEKLQEEFKRMSAEMSPKIEEQEKLALKENAEANNLCKEKKTREELLHNAEELHQIKSQYQTIHSGIAGVTVSRSESVRTKEDLEILHGWKLEKEDLERHLVLMKKETERLMQENALMKSQISLKTTKGENLHLEVKKLRLKNNEVKNQLLELELEKEDMKKELSKLQGGLCKKDKEPMQDEQERSVAHEESENSNTNTKLGDMKDLSLEKTSPVRGNGEISNLLNEIESLKEKNRSMEQELKEMHSRYSEISLRFAEVEGQRQELVMTLRNLKSGKKN